MSGKLNPGGGYDFSWMLALLGMLVSSPESSNYGKRASAPRASRQP